MVSDAEFAKLRKIVEEAHFRLDELEREVAKIKDPSFVAGVVHGHVQNYLDGRESARSAHRGTP
jgi:hypothetical protein